MNCKKAPDSRVKLMVRKSNEHFTSCNLSHSYYTNMTHYQLTLELVRCHTHYQTIYHTPGNKHGYPKWSALENVTPCFKYDNLFRIYWSKFWVEIYIFWPPEATIQHSTASKRQFRQKPLTHPARVHQATQAFHVLTSFQLLLGGGGSLGWFETNWNWSTKTYSHYRIQVFDQIWDMQNNMQTNIINAKGK